MYRVVTIAAAFFFLASCNIFKKTSQEEVFEYYDAEPIVISSTREYKGSQPLYHNLIHTKLDVRPDWQKEWLYGKATLTLVPYFYPQKTLVLDAKGFEINEVSLVQNGNKKPLLYTYNELKLNITFEQTHTRQDTFTVFIDYVAKPSKKLTRTQGPIQDEKGLYFINPRGEDPHKPRQIWTQGETEYSSRWFPTIDQPNVKTTQEIAITVDTNFVTLSNGQFIYSGFNNDGTRTDHYRQDLPHAPYLFMMAIGEFAVVKDSWRDTVPVHYYVEKEYEPYAQMVFGNTPEMMEFYSNILGVDYPWPKYHQVVVRDFVSGAMENTGASVFYSALQHDAREHLDNPHEDIIAHELFHQWFGDYVTCESWGNLTLNEAFATYGEYLWFEYKYGREEADYHLQQDYGAYLREANIDRKPLIRYYYEAPNDMFDRHTYQKGGLVLHMLRKYVGDDAFYASLNKYLTTHKFQPVEHDELRLSFEKITGQDLRWFFDQWFEKPGHPMLLLNYFYRPETKEAVLTVKQLQEQAYYPVFRVPLAVDVYIDGEPVRYNVLLKEESDTFIFPAAKVPDLILFDAEDELLSENYDPKHAQEWQFQFNKTSLYRHREEALQNYLQLTDNDSFNIERQNFIRAALDDDFWAIRRATINELEKLDSTWVEKNFTNKLSELAKNDASSQVRLSAVNQLAGFENPAHQAFFIILLKDSSYKVVSAALGALALLDADLAMQHAEQLEEYEQLAFGVADLYSKKAGPEKNKWFKAQLEKKSGFDLLNYLFLYEIFLERMDDNLVLESLADIADVRNRLNSSLQQRIFIRMLQDLEDHYVTELAGINLIEEKTAIKKNIIEKLKSLQQQVFREIESK